jgi:hypothetical protein
MGIVYTLGLMWSPGSRALLTTFIFQRNLRGLGWVTRPVRYLIASYTPLPIRLTAGGVYVYRLAFWRWGGVHYRKRAGGPAVAGFILSNGNAAVPLGGYSRGV